MKRIVALSLICALAVSMAACGSSDAEETATQEESVTTLAPDEYLELAQSFVYVAEVDASALANAGSEVWMYVGDEGMTYDDFSLIVWNKYEEDTGNEAETFLNNAETLNSSYNILSAIPDDTECQEWFEAAVDPVYQAYWGIYTVIFGNTEEYIGELDGGTQYLNELSQALNDLTTAANSANELYQ